MAKQDIFQGSVAVTETARDGAAHSGLLAGLFEGDVRWDLLGSVTIPPLSPAFSDFFQKFKALLTSLDPDRVDNEGELPEPLLNGLAELGALGLKIPTRFGGQGFTQYEYQQIATLCGSFDASLTVFLSAAQSIGVPEPLRLFGTEDQQAKYLPRLARGEISGFALTEKSVGCDIAKVESYAMRVKENGRTVAYRLTGEKFFITNSAKSDSEFLSSMLVVIARIVDDPSELQDPRALRRYGAFIVEPRQPGCSVTRLRFEGVRGIYNGAPTFDNVLVPVDNRLGSEEDGLRIALATLTVGRLTLPAACVGGLKQCLSLMRWWAGRRVQWNKPIGEHTLVGQKLCRAAAYSFALEGMMALCGAWANDKKSDLRLESAAAKVIGSEWYWDVVNDLFQVRGGRGFMTVESQRKNGEFAVPVMRMLRDARINLVWEGTSEILRVWMAREALSPYIEQGLAFLEGPLSKKLGAPLYYARMAFRACVPSLTSRGASALCGRDHARWIRFVEASARRLTRATLAVTVRHRQRLQHKQLLLQDLVNDGLTLFSMTAVLWYASQEPIRSKAGTRELCDFFCREMAAKLSRGSGNSDTAVYKLARRIMDGEYAWLEDGIMPLREP